MERPPAELKFIYPFVRRGEEMMKVDKVVFYYCRQIREERERFTR